MKFIIVIIDIVLTLVIIAGVAWAGLKVYTVYNRAEQFETMSTVDKGIMYIMDNDEYNKLQNSHNIVTSILKEIGR